MEIQGDTVSLTFPDNLGDFGIRRVLVHRGVILVDTRCDENIDPWEAPSFAPWGITLYCSERAAYALGLYGKGKDQFSVPASCSGCPRLTEKALEKEYFDKMVEHFRGYEVDYNKYPIGPLNSEEERPAIIGKHGAVALYTPLCVAFSNYGWGILCNRNSVKYNPL